MELQVKATEQNKTTGIHVVSLVVNGKAKRSSSIVMYVIHLTTKKPCETISFVISLNH